ncbi:hypothetical protein POM88_010109 [Heracleum sosnowskyi]|uniref:Protein kinase domain-containing protein n=1 Tax=Heracleum sosnowskyi TaxID=360622 RepID=A0AAD8N928_9APIA|nr:hypothetical protein POM88_010109 [Heracleum sosnowskyi]
MSQTAEATHNFSSSLRFGPRISGTVYKGELQDGQVVVVKRTEKEHFEDLKVEIKTVVELLVKLLGYVDAENDSLIITEYVPNGLRGNPLVLHQRLEIVIDIAQDLTYLHKFAEKEIIHGDIKSTNILLTESMRAKVADFGFVRHGYIGSARTHARTHASQIRHS